MKRLLYLMRKFQTFHRYNVCSDVLFSILLIKNVKFAFKSLTTPRHLAHFPPDKSYCSLSFGFIYFQNGQFSVLDSKLRFLLTNQSFCLKPQLRLRQYCDLSTSRRYQLRPVPRW